MGVQDNEENANPLIKRLMAVFGLPENTPDVAQFIAEYRNLISGFGPNVLERAGNHLIRNGGHKWPTPKQCVDACNDAQEALAGEAAAKSGHKPARKMPWELNQEQANEWARGYVLTSPLGAEARIEGWVHRLELYAASHACQCLNSGRPLPPPAKWRPPSDVVADYKKYRG